MLFRCDSSRGGVFGPWLTRAVTSSHFDHVALIMRFGDTMKDLYILEAVGERGVRLLSWLSLRAELYPGGFFGKIVTRKLLYEMTPEKLNDLDKFRKNCVGLSYGLSPRKILFNSPSEPDLQ